MKRLLSINFITGTILVSIIVHYIEKYLFADWQFAVSMVIMVLIDTMLGFVKHYKAKTVSSKGFGDVFIKVLIYTSMLMVTHILSHFKIGGSSVNIFAWIDYLVYSGILLREAISIFENITAISPGIISSKILKRLKQFDAEGKELEKQ